MSISTGRCSLVGVAVSRLGLLAGLPTRTAAGPDANHSVQSMRQRHGVAIDLGPTRPSALSRAVDAPASEAAAVMDQIGAKLENSKTISGVVAQSVHALPSQHLRNSESGFQNLTSNLSWPGVGRDHRCRWMHFSADIEQNLMGSARLNEANP